MASSGKTRTMWVLCAALTLLVMGYSLFASTEAQTKIVLSAVAEKAPGGHIDWGKEMFYAVGEGAVPSRQEEPNRARALLRAKDYAKMDAIANMRMLIDGTSISYSAVGQDYIAKDVNLQQKIEGYVKNVVVLSVEQIKHGKEVALVKVTVGCPMYGHEGPASALLQKASELASKELPELQETPVRIEAGGKVKVVQPTTLEMKPVESPPVKSEETAREEQPSHNDVKSDAAKFIEATDEPREPSETPSRPSKPVAAHTGVIIDTLGLNVMRAMSPKIRTQGGAEVWGTLKLDADEVQERGPVAYVRTIAEAKNNPRAGSNPLILKAIGRAGGRKMCDVVLSDEDVEKLRSADEAANPSFLKAMNVIFVVDPIKL